MRKGYVVLQAAAVVIVVLLLVSACRLLIGASLATAVRVCKGGLALASLFAFPCLAMALTVKLRGVRGPGLTMHRFYALFRIGMVITFFISMIAFGVAYPYAPISVRDGDLRDKIGRAHTSEQYDRFMSWQSAFILVGTSMMVSVLGALPAEIGRPRNDAR